MEKAYKLFRILCFFIGFLISCEKDRVNPDNSDEQKIPVIAGIFDSSGIYSDLSPSMLIAETEKGCLFYTGNGSIDIDNDKNIDMSFNSWNQIPDISGECCDCPDDSDIICDCWPSGRIYKYIHIQDTSFQIACDTNLRAVCFSSNDTIEIWRNWAKKGKITLIDLYNFPPPEISYGNWISDSDKYLGIRKIFNDTTYGWLRLNLSKTIEVKELYLERL